MPPTDAPREAVARDLLRIGAVLLRPDDPFTWASGLRSPIYCDNRLTLSEPAVRRRLTDGFLAVLDREGLAPDVIAGTATAGIPHAAWLADRLELPMVYVRASAKGHGRGNQIEGRLDEGARVVLVEDLVSTGGSSLAAVEALRAAGAEVRAVVAVFSYGLGRAEAAFRAAGVPLFTLTDYDTLLDVARAEGRLDDNALAALRAWREDPEGWGSGDRVIGPSGDRVM
ncbi:MAG TPA: orotate phosphoribosyltransferase [Rubricoccaceae bacterium]|nr:orotate phosphoribosyltransferase [Rubricoccaceae bacterium]